MNSPKRFDSLKTIIYPIFFHNFCNNLVLKSNPGQAVIQVYPAEDLFRDPYTILEIQNPNEK